jgi:hypothetical protein
MGTSYTDYGPTGFWASDTTVETWPLCLVAGGDVDDPGSSW